MQKYIKIKKTDRKIILAYIMLVVLGINYLEYAFFGNVQVKNTMRICVVLLVGYAFIIRSKLQVWDVILLCISLCLLVNESEISLNVVFLFLIAITFSMWELNDICKAMNFINIVSFIVVIISLLFNVVDNTNWTYLGRTRNTLGFSNVNNAGFLAYSISTVYLLSLEKIKWKDIVLIVGFSFGIYKLTDSRTGFLALLIMIICFYLLAKTKGKIEFGVWVIEILCLASPLFWSNRYINSPIGNKILSLRPRIFCAYIDANTWTNFLFGGSKVREIDNFYLIFLFGTGILVYLLFGLCVLFTVNRLLNNEEYMKVAFIISMLLMGMMESNIIRPELMCVTLFWLIIYREGKNLGK